MLLLNHLNNLYNYFCPSTDKPGPPGMPEVTGTDNKSVALKWTVPESDGGAPIFNYVVEYRLETSRSWERANLKGDNVAETTYSVQGLREGKEYCFRVSAENKAGVGEPSKPTAPVKVVKPIGRPMYSHYLSFHVFCMLL